MYSKRLATLFITCLIAAGCTPESSNPPPVVNTPSPKASVTPPAVSPYENKLVRRPGKSMEDGKVYLVENGKKRWVVNASWFAAHGFKFPEAVIEITPAALDAIPIGDPIEQKF